MTKFALDQRIDQINRFEAMLVNEGALVLKFWFHLTKDGQKKRLKALEKDPKTAWRVTKWNWDRLKTYDKLQDVAGHVLRMTNTPWAPWIIVEGTDDRYRSLTVGKIMLDSLKQTPGRQDKDAHAGGAAGAAEHRRPRRALRTRPDAQADQEGLRDANWRNGRAGSRNWCAIRASRQRSLVCVFEGCGCRRQGRQHPPHRRRDGCAPVPDHADRRADRGRARPALPVALLAPHAAHGPGRHLRPLLVRPRAGRAGRGLLRRGRLAARLHRDQRLRARAGRAPAPSSSSSGCRSAAKSSCKRFKEREKIEFKRFKITEEDWRNREKWDAYHRAVCDMVDRTSTGNAPWTLVEANDKNYRPGQDPADRLRAAGRGAEEKESMIGEIAATPMP